MSSVTGNRKSKYRAITHFLKGQSKGCRGPWELRRACFGGLSSARLQGCVVHNLKKSVHRGFGQQNGDALFQKYFSSEITGEKFLVGHTVVNLKILYSLLYPGMQNVKYRETAQMHCFWDRTEYLLPKLELGLFIPKTWDTLNQELFNVNNIVMLSLIRQIKE